MGRAATARPAPVKRVREAPGRSHPPRRRPVRAHRPVRRVSGHSRLKAAGRARGARVLDALLTGRACIAVVGLLLAGIVFFNVDLLQMNREITQMADRAAQLKRENARLRLDVARLASSERIQETAAALGLVLPAPGEVRYLESRPLRDAKKASKRISAPDPSYVTPDASATVPDAPTTASQGAQTTDPTATGDPTGGPVDPATGLPVDPATGRTIYSPTGQALDPATGLPVSTE